MYSENPYLKRALESLPIVEGRYPEKIGYVVNYSFHIWYRIIIEVLHVRGAQYGIGEVLVRDARQDLQIELAAVDELIAEKVDILIVTPVAGEGTEQIVEKADRAGIPLVIEANPVKGMSTMIAICDYDAGVKAGTWAGEYAREHFNGAAKVLDIAYPALRPCLLRSEGFMDGLRLILPDAELVRRINGEVQIETSKKYSTEALREHPEINIIFGMDDESTRGGMEAVRALGINQDEMMLIGFGMAGDEDKDVLLEKGAWRASVAMFPEWVGLMCLDQGIRLYNGMKVNLHEVTPTVAISPDTLPEYFSRESDRWVPNFRAIAAIPREGECTRV